METAYLLIRTSPGHERDVYYKLRTLKGINGVNEVHPVIGNCNLVVKVKADSFEKLGYVVVDKINHLEDIIRTEVLIVPSPNGGEKTDGTSSMSAQD